jgi:hypothetical protein
MTVPDAGPGTQPPKASIPPYFWRLLSPNDKNEFTQLRSIFYQNKGSMARHRRALTFANELHMVLDYIERAPDNMESRAIVSGICFTGPIICVNTRQLKSLLSRCKSSINGILQELGYASLRPRSKTRSCIFAILPSIERTPEIARHWSVRHASERSSFCFVSKFPTPVLPTIAREDLDQEPLSEPFFHTTPAVPRLGLDSCSVPLVFRVESLLSQPTKHNAHSEVVPDLFDLLH